MLLFLLMPSTAAILIDAIIDPLFLMIWMAGVGHPLEVGYIYDYRWYSNYYFQHEEYLWPTSSSLSDIFPIGGMRNNQQQKTP